jgi:hypothetical protein
MRGTVAKERRVADENPANACWRRRSVQQQGHIANGKLRFVSEKCASAHGTRLSANMKVITAHGKPCFDNENRGFAKRRQRSANKQSGVANEQ